MFGWVISVLILVVFALQASAQLKFDDGGVLAGRDTDSSNRKRRSEDSDLKQNPIDNGGVLGPKIDTDSGKDEHIDEVRKKRSILKGDEGRVIKFTNTVLYAVGLDYERKHVHEAHSRVRRSLNPYEEVLSLDVKSHNREFKLRLRRDESVYSNDFQGKKMDNRYHGKLEDEPNSYVYGFVHDDGAFEGRIRTQQGDLYSMESIKRYTDVEDKHKYHSVIYNARDIVMSGGSSAIVSPQSKSFMGDKSKRKSDGLKQNNSAKIRKRRSGSFTASKPECRMFVSVDVKLVEWAGSEDAAMNIALNHVKASKEIYEATDFNQDGTAEGITLAVKTTKVFPGSNACSGTYECSLAGDTVSDLLGTFGNADYSDYCLAYIFSNRDYGGTLGRAYLAKSGYAGGICDKTYNQGWVTRKYPSGQTSEVEGDLTTAHEIGHNFGGEHDNNFGGEGTTCFPEAFPNTFIMYFQVSYGDKSNNKMFSTCSRSSMWAMIDSRTCFEAKSNLFLFNTTTTITLSTTTTSTTTTKSTTTATTTKTTTTTTTTTATTTATTITTASTTTATTTKTTTTTTTATTAATTITTTSTTTATTTKTTTTTTTATTAATTITTTSTTPTTSAPISTLQAQSELAHNSRRAYHVNTDPLTWDSSLAADAQAYAEELARTGDFKHASNLQDGENLYYAGSSSKATIENAAAAWYAEEVNYDYLTGTSKNGGVIGHFTQMVWRGSTRFGVGIATSGSSFIKTYIVARYSPPGNYIGQYVANVGPKETNPTSNPTPPTTTTPTPEPTTTITSTATTAATTITTTSTTPTTSAPMSTLQAQSELAHNSRRAYHVNTDPLTWDSSLAADAQAYAEELARTGDFKHASNLQDGENLYYAGSSSKATIENAAAAWYAEEVNYDYLTGTSKNGGVIGHFTQMVWRGSTRFGVGIATSGSSFIKTYIVARYSPPGNYIGQYVANVGPKGTNPTSNPTTPLTTPTPEPTTTITTTTTFTRPTFSLQASEEKLMMEMPDEQSEFAHNQRRAKHEGTDPLTWDSSLAADAQAYAEELARTGDFKHASNLQDGENLYYAGSSSKATIENAAAAWYEERENYNYATGESKNGKVIGHFTQMVWKGSKRFGVGIATSQATGSSFIKTYIVARYSPRGNYIGQYVANVGTDSGEVIVEKEPPPEPEPAGETGTSYVIKLPPFIMNAKKFYNFLSIKVYIFPVQIGGPKSVKDLNTASKRKFYKVRLVLKFSSVLQIPSNGNVRCGQRSSSVIYNKYSRRRRNTDNDEVPDNSPLQAETQYQTFVEADTSANTTLQSELYPPVTTQPAGVTEPLCIVQKSCLCENVPVVNMTFVNGNITYFGLGDGSVNISLTYLGIWNNKDTELLCQQAQCNSTLLQQAITNITNDLNTAASAISTIETAKTNVRKVLDCKVNEGSVKSQMYDHYEGLCKRKISLMNIETDLNIKRNLFEKELKRCNDRSWLRTVIEASWRKT